MTGLAHPNLLHHLSCHSTAFEHPPSGESVSRREAASSALMVRSRYLLAATPHVRPHFTAIVRLWPAWPFMLHSCIRPGRLETSRAMDNDACPPRSSQGRPCARRVRRCSGFQAFVCSAWDCHPSRSRGGSPRARFLSSLHHTTLSRSPSLHTEDALHFSFLAATASVLGPMYLNARAPSRKKKKKSSDKTYRGVVRLQTPVLPRPDARGDVVEHGDDDCGARVRLLRRHGDAGVGERGARPGRRERRGVRHCQQHRAQREQAKRIGPDVVDFEVYEHKALRQQNGALPRQDHGGVDRQGRTVGFQQRVDGRPEPRDDGRGTDQASHAAEEIPEARAWRGFTIVSTYAADPGVWKCTRPGRASSHIMSSRVNKASWVVSAVRSLDGSYMHACGLYSQNQQGSAKTRRNHSAKNPVGRVKACVELKFNISGAIEGELQHQNNAASDHTFSINPERSDMSGW
nr:hypothetical protein CFP56_76246 [Quercus suber]